MNDIYIIQLTIKYKKICMTTRQFIPIYNYVKRLFKYLYRR